VLKPSTPLANPLPQPEPLPLQWEAETDAPDAPIAASTQPWPATFGDANSYVPTTEAAAEDDTNLS